MWVSYATSGGDGPYGVVRLDPDTLLPRGRTILDKRAVWNGQPLPIITTADAVWVGVPGRLVKIDPTTGKITLTVRLSGHRLGSSTLTGLAELRGSIWAQTDAGTVARIDERSGSVTRVGRLSLVGPIAAGGGSLWIADPVDGQVWRFDPKPPHRAHYITIGLNASGIAYGDGGVWVSSAIDGTVVRIDPATEHMRRFSVGSTDRCDRVPGRRARGDDRRRVGHCCRKQRTGGRRPQCRLVYPGDLRRTGTATVRDRRQPQPRCRTQCPLHPRNGSGNPVRATQT